MKKGKSKRKKMAPTTQQTDINSEKENIVKQVGTYNGFLIYDKNDEIKENNLNFKINELSEPTLKGWMIIQHNDKKTKSRFSSLFQEIIENDRKPVVKKNGIINQSFEESLLPNNIINDIDDDIEMEKNDDTEKLKLQIKNINLGNEIFNKKFKSNNKINNNNLNINIISNKNSFNNNYFNSFHKDKNNNKNINIINNYNQINLNIFPNNNIINNNNIFLNFNNNSISNINSYMNDDPQYLNLRNSIISNGNSNSGYSSGVSTASSSLERNTSAFSFMSNSSNSSKDSFNYSNKISIHEQNLRNSGKKFDLNVDIKKIIILDDTRTTLMIKNIPNKFKRDLLLNLINQNFKVAYDLFILPTDKNNNKNYGYSFINFTSSYYIPYFYFLFNNKKWSNTNSQKTCEITFSKIQGKNNLLSHYSSKIIYKNEEVEKDESKQKFKIPNIYSTIFFNEFPNYNVENYDNYFLTNIPFRY